MAEFCKVFNVSPSEYKALTLNEYFAFINTVKRN
jgi:hypothetical protein